MTARPSEHATWMQTAKTWAARATCPRLAVGAVIVRGGLQVSQGYNGAARGAAHCTDAGCDLQHVHGKQSCMRAIHAEHNAVLNAARAGHSTLDSTLYVTHAPCVRCADVLIQAGISTVVYGEAYGLIGVDKLQQAGVRVQRFGIEVG